MVYHIAYIDQCFQLGVVNYDVLDIFIEIFNFEIAFEKNSHFRDTLYARFRRVFDIILYIFNARIFVKNPASRRDTVSMQIFES